MTAAAARVDALFVHPVKSCRAVRVGRVRVTPTGFAHDREWMVVDGDGRFVTQREEPRLALLSAIPGDGVLALSSPAGAGPRLALDHEGPRVTAGVWRSRVTAFDAGDEAAGFFSGWLGRAVRLVRFDPAHQRLSNRDWTGGLRAPNLFTDGYPLLVLSHAAVEGLAARVGRPLALERFRANIVLGGVPAHAEDTHDELDLGAVALRLGKPCTRCAITTVDPATGARPDAQPLPALQAYRRDRALRGVTFGRNAVLLRGAGEWLEAGQPAVLR